jgi:optic atrophy 3 protein
VRVSFFLTALVCRRLLATAIHIRLTKLAGLVIKTLAKPLSKRIKHEFSRSEFSRGVLIGFGQSMHRMQSRLTIWSQGYKVRSIKELDDEKALVYGAEFVGETFLLFVSGGLVLYEYNNSNEKARIKEEKHRAETKAAQDELQSKLKAIDVRLKALEAVVKSNSHSILSLGQQRYVPPDERELVPLELSSAREATTTATEAQAETNTRRGFFRRNVAREKPDEAKLSAAQSDMDRVDLESTRSDNVEDRPPSSIDTAVGAPSVAPEDNEQDQSNTSPTSAPWWRRLWPPF